MRILFINPSLRPGFPNRFLPVGIASVMTFVRQRCFDFDFLDVDINDHDDAHVEDFLATHPYDVILSGSIVTHYKWMKWLTKTVKKHQPQAKVVIGNSVAGSVPETFLRHSGCDVVVIGEGEFTTADLLEALRDNKSLNEIEGIAFLSADGTFIKTPKRKASNINDLPMIDWDFFDVERYLSRPSTDHGRMLEGETARRVMPVTAARGCAFKCTFCHYVFWDDPYRHRSPASILAEVKRNIDRYGANYINFWDDLSFSSLRQAEAMADAILASGLEFEWSAAVRVDVFGHPRFPYERRLEVARKLREAGCMALGFSLESGSQDILDMMNKRIEPGYFKAQVEILRKAGITCNTSVVFGYPIETAETIQATFDQCLDVGLYPSIGFLLPLPYTGMYAYAKEHGFITDEDAYLDSITERQDICLNMTRLSDEELLSHIKEGASRLNERLRLGLDRERLVRTGGYRNHHQSTSRDAQALDQDHLRRIPNDVSFNYSQATFETDLGARSLESSCASQDRP